MLIKAAEEFNTGDLVCIRVNKKNEPRLVRWTIGQDAIGVTTRLIKLGEAVEYSPEESTNDILIRGSRSPMSGNNIVMRACCSLTVGELVCVRHAEGQAILDRWNYGDEAVGAAARDIKADEFINFCAGRSTADIQVKPNK